MSVGLPPIHPEVAARMLALKPCPFCDSPLVEAAAFRTRDSAYMVHKPTTCVGRPVQIVIFGAPRHEGDLSREQQWNAAPRLKLDGWEWSKLSSHAESHYLTYAGHAAGAGLFPEERATMQRWSDLADKLKANK